MFERFTERAKQAVVLAQEECCLLKHGYLGSEHILIGLLREEHGLGSLVLRRFDVTPETVQAKIISIVGEGQDPINGQIPFTPRAKNVLERALREALSLGHNYIGTEHILLGLTSVGEGVAMRILAEEYNLDAEKIRNEVIRMLSGPDSRPPTPQPFLRQDQPPAAADDDSHEYQLETGNELDAVRAACQRAEDELGRISVVLNRAGVPGWERLSVENRVSLLIWKYDRD